MPEAQQDPQATIKRMAALMRSLENQRNEALTSRAHSDANQAFLQEQLEDAQKRIAELEKKLPKDQPKGKKN